MDTNKDPKLRSAKAELLLAFRKADRLGLNPHQIIVDDEATLKKLDTQLFILKLSGISVVVAPYCYYGLKYIAAWQKVPFDFPEKDFNSFIFFNIGAIVAYGFSSGIRALIKYKRDNSLQSWIVKRLPELDITLPPHQIKEELRDETTES